MQKPPKGEPEGSDPSPVGGSTVINAGTGLRIGSHRLFLAPPSLVTPAWGRGYDPPTREDEPRMNGRGAREVRGCAAVTA